MSMYCKLETRQANGKWKAVPGAFATTIDAFFKAASYDPDGYVHPALWRVIGPDGVVYKPESE